jgi:hypothetical protein
MNFVFQKNKNYILLLFLLFVSVLIYNGIKTKFNVSDLDHHWQYSLNYATTNDFVYGKDVIFTYGPLSFVAYPITEGLNYFSIFLSWAIRFIYVAYFLGIVIEFSENITTGLSKEVGFFTRYMLIPIMLVNIGLSEYSILIFICLIHSALIAFNNLTNTFSSKSNFIGKKYLGPAFTGLTLSLLFFIKVSFLPFLIAIPLLLVANYIIKKEFNLLTVFLGTALFSFLLIKTSYTIEIADYVMNAIELIEGYRKAMQLIYWPNYIGSYYLSLFLISLFAIHVISNRQMQKKSIFFSIIIILLSVYFLFTYSYTRGWAGGVIYKIPYVCFIFYFTNYLTNDSKWIIRNNYIIILILFISFFNSRFYFIHLKNLVTKNETLEPQSHKIIPSNYIKENETYDTYPTNSGFAYFNNLKYKPRPTIQSYSAYTTKLDSKTADFFLNKQVDHMIFFGDLQNGFWQNAIDNRYFMFDEPLTKLAILKNYEITNKINDSLFIASKRKSPINITFTLTKSIQLDLDQSLSIDESLDKNELYFFTIDFAYTTYAKIKGMIYRMPFIKAEIVLNSGEKKTFNVVPDLLKSPSILNRYCSNYSDFFNLLEKTKATTQSIKSIQFKPNSKRGFENSAIINIYKATVEEVLIADENNSTEGNQSKGK